MQTLKVPDYFSKIMLDEGKSIQKIQINPVETEGLLWVKSGLAKVFCWSEKGLKINTDLIFENEFYWVRADNYSSAEQFFIEAMKYSDLRFLPISRLDQAEKDALPALLFEINNNRLKRIHQQKVRNFDLELKDRVFFFLFDFCLLFGKLCGPYYVFPNFFTHDEISSILKNCRQNVTACLNGFKKNDVILYNRKEIKIKKEIFEYSLRKFYGYHDLGSQFRLESNTNLTLK